MNSIAIYADIVKGDSDHLLLHRRPHSRNLTGCVNALLQPAATVSLLAARDGAPTVDALSFRVRSTDCRSFILGGIALPSELPARRA